MLELIITMLIASLFTAPAALLAILEEKRDLRKEKNDLFFKKIENFKF